MLARRLPLPPPRPIHWPLRSLDSARTSLSYDAQGRMILRIEHAVLKGLTPEMVAWWFANIGGQIEVEGESYEKYLLWHPRDHIRWELAAPAPDGSIGAGARFRIVEAFGRNHAHYIDVIDHVTRLDASGFTAVTFTLGLQSSCLNHDFAEVVGGTRYTSTLTVGLSLGALGRRLNRIVHRTVFDEAMGRAWLQHNIEEVGLLEELIPRAMAHHGLRARAA